MHKLLKIKYGTISWTKGLQIIKPETYRNIRGHVCCNQEKKDLGHLLRECSRFETLREQTIGKNENQEHKEVLKKSMNNNEKFKNLVKYIKSK